jgi:CMP-N,N'-diacetyllegionaminic acid synthase
LNKGKKILCTICARGGSKGVPNKNIRLLNGKPLIAYSIEQAIQSNIFKHIVVSTDSEEIAKVAVRYGAEVFFMRSSDLSSDYVGKIDVIRDAFVRSEKYYKQRFDFLIDIDATSPLRSVQDITKAFDQFHFNDNDILITATPSRRSPYFNLVELTEDGKVSLSKEIGTSFLRRQDVPKAFDMNASIYVWKRSSILNEHTLFTEKTGLYVMPEARSIDIDTELDFKIVEFILKSNQLTAEV